MPARSILGLAPQSVQYMYLDVSKGVLRLPVGTQGRLLCALLVDCFLAFQFTAWKQIPMRMQSPQRVLGVLPPIVIPASCLLSSPSLDSAVPEGLRSPITFKRYLRVLIEGRPRLKEYIAEEATLGVTKEGTETELRMCHHTQQKSFLDCMYYMIMAPKFNKIPCNYEEEQGRTIHSNEEYIQDI